MTAAQDDITAQDLNHLLDTFDSNPRVVTGTLRTLHEVAPRRFGDLAIEILLERQSRAGLRPLTSIALGDSEFLSLLCSPGPLKPDQAARVLRRMIEFHPLADLRVAHAVMERFKEDEAVIARTIGILDAVSKGPKLVPIIGRLLRHLNPDIRSRAALFVGHRTQNVSRTRRQMLDENNRVRANAVETLQGVDSPAARETFWSALQDPDNRVVGNAAAALYDLGDTEVLSEIQKLCAHPSARFRRTAAWVMGKTGDPRFAELLMGMLSDPERDVQRQAFAALQAVKQSICKSQIAPGLDPRILCCTPAGGDSRNMIMTVRAPNGDAMVGLPPTAIVLREAGKPVFRYSVNPVRARETLNIAFLIDEAWGPSNANFAAADEGLRRALRNKRAGDRWALVRTRPGDETCNRTAAEVGVVFQTARATLEKTLDHPALALRQSLTDALPTLMRHIVTAIGTCGGRRHVVCLLDAKDSFLDDSQAWFRAALHAKMAVHVICAGDAAANYGLERITQKSGGMLLRASTAPQIELMLEAVCSALVSHYDVQWENPGELQPVSLRLYYKQASGHASYPDSCAALEPAGKAADELVS